MLVYLAARYSRREELCGYRDDLREAGIEVTSRWLDGTHQYGADAERAEADLGTHADMARRFAREDLDDLLVADAIVSFTEEPRRSSTNRGGRHVEHGFALGLLHVRRAIGRKGVRILVVGWRENAFHYLAEVEFHPAWPDALAALVAR